ncbi:MAG: enoyl-CoA hydratase-related protein, partial [Gammaproteobacteria bacterium]|nr:enoyl-CoA hydratase-related protein [Gammaproteobacteria bacterium]
MNELVTLDVSDGIADVRLNRPDKHNSLTLDMFRAIAAAGESLADPAIRVAVLSGNGPSFCAGLDFSIMRAILDGG